MEFNNGLKEEINTSQGIYDSFNDFIFSKDLKVLAKFIARLKIFEQTKNVPGDIIECGVFKGSGIASWLKIKRILNSNSFKKIIGFDFFDTEELLKTLNGIDKERMENLFKIRQFDLKENYINILKTELYDAGFLDCDFELIKGDISNSAINYVNARPGAKISILYMDIDLAQPTYDTLNIFWNRISNGGMIIFDEYGYHQWSEAQGADKFANEKNLRIQTLNYNAPTAYIIKE
jgi:hypothetical protein